MNFAVSTPLRNHRRAPSSCSVAGTNHPPRAFTLIELLTVIAIIGILAAILIPVVGKVRQAARGSTTTSNLRQVGVAMSLFTADNKQRFPVHWSTTQQSWIIALSRYANVPFDGVNLENGNTSLVLNGSIFDYPFQREPYADQQGYGFGFNALYLTTWGHGGPYPGSPSFTGMQTSQVKNPSKTVMVMPSEIRGVENMATSVIDAPLSRLGAGLPYLDPSGACWALFVDGHVEKFSRNQDTPIYHRLGGDSANSTTQGDSLWDLE